MWGDRKDWVEVTPESVAISSLRQCLGQLECASEEPLAIFHAAVEAYRALQAALTAALAGSANIGASPPKIRSEWLRWFEKDRDKRTSKTPSWKVMGVREMLLEAVIKKLPWTASPLRLSAQESHWIGRLLFYRDSFEHPKQLTFVMTKAEIADAIDGSVEVIHRAMLTVDHQIFEETELLAAVVRSIQMSARQIGGAS